MEGIRGDWLAALGLMLHAILWAFCGFGIAYLVCWLTVDSIFIAAPCLFFGFVGSAILHLKIYDWLNV